MLRDGDTRHGTTAGHMAGCRNTCCREAKLAYDKRRKYEANKGVDRTVPAWRALRRVQALQALGWSVPRMAEASEGRVSYKTLYGLNRVDSVWASTFEDIDWLYRRLQLNPPSSGTPGVTRAKRHAERVGWPPPLAWDDVDDPFEEPTGWHYEPADRASLVRAYLERGDGLTQILRALKLSRVSFEKWMDRNDMRPEFNRLLAAERMEHRQGKWAS